MLNGGDVYDQLSNSNFVHFTLRNIAIRAKFKMTIDGIRAAEFN